MLFNTFVFLLFFLVVYAIFLVLGNFAKRYPLAARGQNLWLLAASYFFYGWWDWIFLTLIIVSTFVDYSAALGINGARNQTQKRIFLWFSILSNLGILFTMKYFNFFADSFIYEWNALSGLLGWGAVGGSHSLLLRSIVLPVGISFYTFQTMSYTIDVYRGQIPVEKDFFDFALFVTYFPQLVAGPIERAGDLIPQLKKPKFPNSAILLEGVWDILLGYFLKVYVADNLGPLVDQVYFPNKEAYLAHTDHALGMGGGQVLSATLGFLIQIYCDFAGYSFIALGVSRFLGVQLTVNFETPEYSATPIELWTRWHVTLNRWFREYVYFPLGGSRTTRTKQIRNILLVFGLSGLWHGANWTFITWGLLNGIFTVIYMSILWNFPPTADAPEKPVWIRIPIAIGSRLLTFLLFALSAVGFRAYDTNHMLLLYSQIFSPWNLTDQVNGILSVGHYFWEMLRIALPLLVIDYFVYTRKDRYFLLKKGPILQALVFILLFGTIILKGIFGKEVIYFAF
ncbi:membrane-bound O-acyltransferase family MBOAT [Leptospira inadai serovar Lyme str. 10]|uniref:Membrane-bound O-acyltransferase family MBOAT n=2 Tax=Leptospira inadai serovar Lyme TaxID=293084 RepID=V6HRF7_9LEPT|nr:MBOAT family O-acyltransferase [Leptospira inadai]EQA35104.1 membrane-bound O-acyltransferase family MBOAT [Leptospira inadai serovar Lyme str. 10]PNV74168.1 MBOAT family protein [Leptospira inadai serovar Lyme]